MKTHHYLVFTALAALNTTLCFASPPTLGEAVVKTEVQKGTTVVEGESRYLMPDGKLGGSNSAVVAVEAKVESIDHANRLFTIHSADGKLTTLKAGPEIANFPQIKAGDKVKVEYFISVAFETREPTQAETLVSGDILALAGTAELGDKPKAAVAARQVKVMTIESIDATTQLVVLRDLDGVLSTVKAKYPENLKLASKGDKIVVTKTEALAAKVTEVN